MAARLLALIICLTISFNVFAGWKAKAFFVGGAIAVHAALKALLLERR
jgi:hypothetical protein